MTQPYACTHICHIGIGEPKRGKIINTISKVT